ncbi:MAG: efflux RND transporter periplasmic adaptor subunit [Alteromonadaceae bacterium]|nr:efflux RND transporter periplasmic adaptor subunit [Alteromonadaceae bacterium]
MIIFKKITIISLTVLSLFNFSAFSQQAPAANVNVAVAQMKLLSPVAWVSGTVVSRNNSQIAAEISGRLVNLSALGARVKQGDIIASIDDKSLKIKQKENKANVLIEQTRLAFFESEVQRQTSLVKKKLLPATELDATISKRDVAKNDVVVAQAQLSQTQQNLAYTQLKAPFDGLVAQRLHNLGEYVNNGTAIIRLVETANVEASVFVPLTTYQFLTQSTSLTVESRLSKYDHFQPIYRLYFWLF